MASLPFSLSDIVERSRKRGDPDRVVRLREKAFEVVKKKGIPEDIAEKILPPREIKEKKVHYEPPLFELESLGGYMVIENYQVVYKAVKDRLRKTGVFVGSTDEAVRTFDRLKGKLFSTRDDFFTDPLKALHVALRSGGTFVYVPKGLKVPFPIHALFTITESLVSQTEHSVVIASEGSEVSYIEGCVGNIKVKYALHLGATETFVGKGAKAKTVSLISRASNIDHRPIKGAIVEEDGQLDMVTVFMRGTSYSAGPVVKTLARSKVSISTYAFYRGVKARSSPKLILAGPGASGLVLNRSVLVDKAYEEFIGVIEAKRGARKSVGHMVCDALLLSDDVVSITTPALHTEENDVSLTHEASVGKISEEVLFYLASSGFSEDEAIALVVRGYLEPATEGMPTDIALSLKAAIEAALKGEY